MSWQLATLRHVLRWGVRPVLARVTSWTFARRSFEVGARLTFRRVRGARSVPATGALAPGLWVEGGATPEHGVVLYLHGGAYLVGSPATYRHLAGRLARNTGCRIYLPDYPLAPEHPAPAAFDAALAVWRALLAAGHRPSDIVIGGDSAGGGLALALLARLLAEGQPPAGCFVFSPWTDLTLSGASLDRNRNRDAVLPRARMEEVRDMARGALAPDDPRISPLFAAYPGSPPVFIAWSETEILRDDGARMAKTLTSGDTPVVTDVQPDAPHVWQLFHGWVPEADASLRKAGEFIREAFRAPRPGES